MVIILTGLHSHLHHGDLEKQYDGQESMSNLGPSSQGCHWQHGCCSTYKLCKAEGIMQGVSLRLVKKWQCLHQIFGTGNESKVPYYTAKPRRKRRDQLTISPCQRSIPLRDRTCILCHFSWQRKGSHIFISCLFCWIDWWVYASSLAIYVQRTTHEDRCATRVIWTFACQHI
jgi:hypothetical protein